ncbi:hypothetical protein KIN20_000853 [Parelaphostrongylus tenuis]|uniref:MARVEL domain-containing protein n=1 Tax=Parelaphostrongylus tenuis TaxID=148309 RepID=A0AAD5LVC3_PARTN|nr:hypothetical protein KIN20_000853 [Parelaphostrongylus tenuis]
MTITSLREELEQSDNVFLRAPHIYKPLQTVNAIILAICVGSTAGSENGILWFIVIMSLLISFTATLIFAIGVQDTIMENISNGKVSWSLVELVYSFVFAVLSMISAWLSFGFANRHLGGTSAGYIATGLFSIIHSALYGIPCAIIYDNIRNVDDHQYQVNNIHPIHPYHDAPYHDI